MIDVAEGDTDATVTVDDATALEGVDAEDVDDEAQDNLAVIDPQSEDVDAIVITDGDAENVTPDEADSESVAVVDVADEDTDAVVSANDKPRGLDRAQEQANERAQDGLDRAGDRAADPAFGPAPDDEEPAPEEPADTDAPDDPDMEGAEAQ